AVSQPDPAAPHAGRGATASSREARGADARRAHGGIRPPVRRHSILLGRHLAADGLRLLRLRPLRVRALRDLARPFELLRLLAWPPRRPLGDEARRPGVLRRRRPCRHLRRPRPLHPRSAHRHGRPHRDDGRLVPEPLRRRPPRRGERVGPGYHPPVALRVSVLALLVTVAVTAGAARAATCGTGRTTFICTDVVVPLDRSGAVPGTITLSVDELPPPVGTPRGAVFLIAGGPGQGSASTFDFASTNTVLLFQALFPGYTLVAYDDRGTGGSGLLNCPALQAAVTPDGQDLLASACAASIGPGAPFYGTADHVEDLEAVRNALGFDKIVLYGVSYGTKLALAYASAHPTHVERMVLDSVLPPDLPDPYSANVARAIPSTLSAFCATACSA